MTTTGELVRRARQAAKMTQSQLSNASGLHQPSISAIEKGRLEPRPETLAKIFAATRTRPSIVLEQRAQEILAAANRHKIVAVSVFGSCVWGRDTPDSDVDLLVQTDDDASLMDISAFTAEAQDILGFKVDVVSARATGPAMTRILAESVPL